MDVISKEKVGPGGGCVDELSVVYGNGDSAIEMEVFVKAPLITIPMVGPLTFF